MVGSDLPIDFFARPQQLVTIDGGRKLNIWLAGEGSPAVILAPGFMTLTADWSRVQPALARTTQVVSYDHAGQGFSDPGPLPRSPRRSAADLKAALSAAGVGPPYVLVGLSMGNFEVRHYAHLYRDEVVGMVLVDPSFDGMAEQMLKATPSDQAWIEGPLSHLRRCEAAARAGDLRPGTEAYAACAFHPQRDLSNTLNTAYHAMSLRTSYWSSLASEYEAAIGRESGDWWPLGDLPLIVLSAGARERNLSLPVEEAEAVEGVWAKGHERLAALSSKGARRIVPGSKHGIHWDRPQAVIAAVLEVFEETRADRTVPLS